MQTKTSQGQVSVRLDLDIVLPEILARVRAGEFVSLAEIATAYGVDKATACRWKARLLNSRLVAPTVWRLSLLHARVRREMLA